MPGLQRVVVFYCNRGDQRSVAFAALAGAMYEKTFDAEVSLVHP